MNSHILTGDKTIGDKDTACYTLPVFSERFQRTIHVARHAMMRMAERNMDCDLLLDLIETGAIKYKG